MRAQECFEAMGHILDNEVEALLPLLIKRSGSVTTGRDNFLAMHADRCGMSFTALQKCKNVFRRDHDIGQIADCHMIDSECNIDAHPATLQGPQRNDEACSAAALCVGTVDSRCSERTEGPVQGCSLPGHLAAWRAWTAPGW